MGYIGQFVAMKVRQHDEDLAFKIYIAESIRLRGEGKMLSVRLSDILLPQESKPEKTAEEAKQDILSEFEKIRGEIDGGKH